MNPKGEKIRFQDFDCKMLRLSHQNFKLFQWPVIFIFGSELLMTHPHSPRHATSAVTFLPA